MKKTHQQQPLISVRGKTMIEVVYNNLVTPNTRFTFIVQQEHVVKFDIAGHLKQVSPDCHLVVTEGVTEGAACSSLLAEHLINNDTPLIIINSDQV